MLNLRNVGMLFRISAKLLLVSDTQILLREMDTMKKLIVSLVTIVMLTVGMNVGLAAPKGELPSSSVGILDVSRVIAESPKVKALQEELNQIGRAYAAQLEAEEPNLSPEELKQKQAIVYQKFVSKKQELEGQVDQSIKQALTEVAKAKKISIIFYKNSVAFGGTDITSEVIKSMK